MTLVKTSLLNAISVAIKILTLLGLNKVLAVYVGPAGYAAIGQLQNAIQMIQTFSGGAINNGVTKYTAEYEDENSQKTLWSSAFKVNLWCCICVAIFVVVFAKELSSYFFKTEEYYLVFICLGFTTFGGSFNTFLLSIVNGKKEIIKYVSINIATSVIGGIFTGLAALYFGVYGALIALVSNQSIVFFVTIFLCRKLNWFKFSSFLMPVNRTELKKLSGFAIAAFISAIAIPLSHIGVREHLATVLGWTQAGYWDAMWKISSVYLMFITMTLTVYYLPRFSEVKTKRDLQTELFVGYKFILPIVICLSCSIYFTRDIIIELLFTSDFSAMRELFKWQLVGDMIKILGWLLGYLLLGRALIKLFVIFEVIFSCLFYIASVLLIDEYGLIGVTYAHVVNYLMYFCCVFLSLKVKKII